MSDEVTDKHLGFILATAEAVGENSIRTLNWSVATKSAKERGWGGSITMRADVSASHMEATDHLCRFFDHGAQAMKELVHLVRGARAERDAALARAEKAEAASAAAGPLGTSATTFSLAAADEARPTVRELAVEALKQELDEGDTLVRMRGAVRTPEDLAHWLAAQVAADGCELLAAAHLDLAEELPELVEHLESQLNEGWARAAALEAAVREAAAAAGLPLVITTERERVVTLEVRELVMALGEAARREREGLVDGVTASVEWLRAEGDRRTDCGELGPAVLAYTWSAKLAELGVIGGEE
jgi:hypothetical protein